MAVLKNTLTALVSNVALFHPPISNLNFLGRTGRIGHRGVATSLFTERDEPIASVLTRTLLETKQDIPEFLQIYVPEGGNIQFETESDFDPNEMVKQAGDSEQAAWGADASQPGQGTNVEHQQEAANGWGGGSTNTNAGAWGAGNTVSNTTTNGNSAWQPAATNPSGSGNWNNPANPPAAAGAASAANGLGNAGNGNAAVAAW